MNPMTKLHCFSSFPVQGKGLVYPIRRTALTMQHQHDLPLPKRGWKRNFGNARVEKVPRSEDTIESMKYFKSLRTTPEKDIPVWERTKKVAEKESMYAMKYYKYDEEHKYIGSLVKEIQTPKAATAKPSKIEKERQSLDSNPSGIELPNDDKIDPLTRRNLMKVRGVRGMNNEEFAALFADYPNFLAEMTSYGYGYVSFTEVNHLRRAHRELNGKVLSHNRKLILSIYDQTVDAIFEITDEQMKMLPTREECPGQVVVVNSNQTVERALVTLLGKKQRQGVVLGMDIEWKPTYLKDEHSKTALLQLSNGDNTVLFRLNLMEKEGLIHNGIGHLLAHPEIIKVGVGLDSDCKRLFDDFGWQVQGHADLAKLPLISRCKPKSLQGLMAMFLGVHHMKSSRMTNWEKDSLTGRQVHYAAMDAWGGRELFRQLNMIPNWLLEAHDVLPKVFQETPEET